MLAAISRLTSRLISATCRIAMVTVGRTRPPQVVNPEAGKIGSTTAKKVSSMMPVQKSGLDCPAMVGMLAPTQIGRVSCGERGEISGGVVLLNKKHTHRQTLDVTS